MENAKFKTHVWSDAVDPLTLDIYKAYHRKTYVGERCAVLVIDLYNKAYRGGPKPIEEVYTEYPSSCGLYAWEAVEPTRILLEKARTLGLPIIYTTSAKGRGKATYRQEEQSFEDDFEIFDAFSPKPEDLIIHKERASAFFGTPLIAYLQRWDIRSLLICGQSTSGCVRASTVDAFSYGFHVALAEECCFDRSLISHKINLFDLHHKYSDVIRAEEVLAEWNKGVIAE